MSNRRLDNKHMRQVLKILMGLWIICVSLSCARNAKSSDLDEQPLITQDFLKDVKTEKAVLSNQNEELTLAGKVDYDPEKVIHYALLVHGMVERTCFSLGDKVHKGQVLLDIRSSELSALRSETLALEADLEVEKRNWQSVQGMYDDKMLSEKELLEAKAKYRQAEAALQRAKSDMSLYRQNSNGTFSILAPMSGYIVDKQVASGSPVVSDGNPLFTVADLSVVWITANVYAGNLISVKEGMDVKITTLSYPDEVFSGKINALSQVFDSEEKVLKARILMPNKELKFKPEMSVVVRLKEEKPIASLAIPNTALIFDNDRYFVVVEKNEGNFEIREVALAAHLDNTAYIRSGIAANENIVVQNQLLIYSGLRGK